MNKLFSLVAIVVLAGCGASYKVNETIKSEQGTLGSFQAVHVAIVAGDDDSADAVEPFRASLIAKIAARAIFSTYITSEDPGAAEIRLDIKLTGFHAVDKTTQAFVGAFAGTGKLTATVVVLDIKGDRTLGGFVVAGKSARGTAYSASTEGGVNAAADGVAEQLLKMK